MIRSGFGQAMYVSGVGAALATALALGASAAAAGRAEPFFHGKVINLYVGAAPGGTYDYYSRLVARFMAGHIPGAPTIVIRSMPGAGSLQAANFLYPVPPTHPTPMALITQHPPAQQV